MPSLFFHKFILGVEKLRVVITYIRFEVNWNYVSSLYNFMILALSFRTHVF
jgi:hypothetical protein